MAWLFYPIKNIQQGIYKNTYLKRKCWQAVVMISVAIFFIHVGNHISRAAMTKNALTYSAETIVLDLNSKQHFQKKKTRKERRSIRKQFRKRLRANIKKLRRVKGKYSLFEKILIYMLVLLAASLVALLVWMVGCGLACNGSEFLALIVLFGGGLAILTGLVLIFRNLFILNKPIFPLIEKPKSEPTNGG